jgi:hypothetical protein
MKLITTLLIASTLAANANWFTNLFESDADRVARECKEEYYRTVSLEQIQNDQDAKDRVLWEARERSFAERYPTVYAKYLSDKQKAGDDYSVFITDYVYFTKE